MKEIDELLLLKERPHRTFETSYSHFFHMLHNRLLSQGDSGELINHYDDKTKAFIFLQLQVMERTDVSPIASELYPAPAVESKMLKEEYGEKLEEKAYFLTRRSKMLLKQRLH